MWACHSTVVLHYQYRLCHIYKYYIHPLASDKHFSLFCQNVNFVAKKCFGTFGADRNIPFFSKASSSSFAGPQFFETWHENIEIYTKKRILPNVEANIKFQYPEQWSNNRFMFLSSRVRIQVSLAPKERQWQTVDCHTMYKHSRLFERSISVKENSFITLPLVHQTPYLICKEHQWQRISYITLKPFLQTLLLICQSISVEEKSF